MNEEFNIWLIDDDEITNFLCREVLKIYVPSAQVTSLENGEVALERLLLLTESNEALPHVILLDVNMPLMNGWELLEKLEELDNKKFSKLNIFILTSSVYFEDAAKAENSKLVKNIITKPLNEEGIMKIMDTVNAYQNA